MSRADWVAWWKGAALQERQRCGVISMATSSKLPHTSSIEARASGLRYLARRRWLILWAICPRITRAEPSAATIRLRPDDAWPCTSIDVHSRRSAVLALRVDDAVSKYRRPSSCRKITYARWTE